MKFIKLHFLTLLISAFALAEANGQTRELGSSGRLLDGVAALVDEDVVLRSELAQQVSLIAQRFREQQNELPPLSVLERQILEQLVIRRIQLQRAQRLGIVVSDEILNRALSDVAQRQNITLEQLPGALAQENIDYALYRQDMREQMILQQLRQRDVIQRIAVSPKELESCRNRQTSTLAQQMDYDISHILISVPSDASPEELDAARGKLDEIYSRLDSGESFAQLAVAFSDGQTALEGGSLGWRKGSQVPTLFADVVAEMDSGGVSQPIQTGSGFHLVRLNDKRGAERIMEDQIRVRHILMVPNEILDDAAIRQKIGGIREEILSGEEFGAIAKAVSEDPISSAEGGDLDWAGPNTYAPEFEQVINALEIGEVSEPFRTRFGWHIAEVTDKRVFDTTENVKDQQCFEQIRASKLEEETELWLRRLRDEAYVEYRM